MPDQAPHELEQRVKSLLASKQPSEAAEAVIAALGPEIGGYLAQLAFTGDEAADIFCIFAEDVWRGLPGFRFESSLRTWCYVIARRALARYRRSAALRRERHVPLSALGPASRIAAQVRDQTATWKKTALKDRVRALREQLDADDRELLLLRIDRDLSFAEIVIVMAAEEELSSAETKKRAASVRKRFERLKVRIKKLAQAEGLL